MSVSALSPSSQNYLKVIWGLQEWSDAPVTPSALAAKAGVALSTVSDAVRKLTERGLLEHAPYGSVTLTPEGRAYAAAMVRRHRLIESFLVQVLNYRWDQVHEEAETLEHAVSDLMVERIDEYLGRPSRDPHGDPIPGSDGRVMVREAVPLSRLGSHERGTVERVSDEDPGLLRFFAERGIGVGSVLEVRPGSPYSDSVEVTVDGLADAVAMGAAATSAVFVSVSATG